MISENRRVLPALAPTAAEVELFQEACDTRPYRDQPQILVVEDQIFSQKLLCDILSGAPTAKNKPFQLDTARGVWEAWQLYLKRAPDIVFADLELIDGSGHTLARSIKELDPTSCVIIVTANNYEEEIEVARRNNVDGFVAEPHSRKQILEYVDRYFATFKTHARGAAG